MIRPILRSGTETRPYRIHEYILSFFEILRVAPQPMVETVFLPFRSYAE